VGTRKHRWPGTCPGHRCAPWPAHLVVPLVSTSVLGLVTRRWGR
jgi:hypothetical protein